MCTGLTDLAAGILDATGPGGGPQCMMVGFNVPSTERAHLRGKRRNSTLMLGTLLAAAPLCSEAFAQKVAQSTTYSIQLDDISVEAPRSRRTDTIYAGMSVQVGTGEARTTTKRLGAAGRGTKAVNMSLPKVPVAQTAHLRSSWVVFNYGGPRTEEVTGALRKATESHVAKSGDNNWLSELLKSVSPVFEEDRPLSCDGPVLAGSFEIVGSDLARETRGGKPLRLTRRQTGLEAPARCEGTSDYRATIVIRSASSRTTGHQRPRRE